MNKNNVSQALGLGLGLVVSCVLTGCAQTPYADAPQYGDAVRQAVSAQTLNPQARQTHLPPPAGDGVTTKLAIDRYHSAFEKPPAPVNVMNIGLGGATGAAAR